MRPVLMENEPDNFNRLVRQPGQLFLVQNPSPSEREWRKKEYWQKILPQMRILYGSICAYSSTWIPHSTGSHSVDHFIAKSINPILAYEWNNYRYVSSRFNSRKGTKIIADPFTIQLESFIIDFATFYINPNSDLLEPRDIDIANYTIQILKLNNDEKLVEERQSYFTCYNNGDISFEYLNSRAPFLASEIVRQGLIL